jgi:hypothetical protein
MKRQLFIVFCIAYLTCSCNEKQAKKISTDKKARSRISKVVSSVADTNHAFEEEIADSSHTIKETRLRFPNFTVVLHDFKGYESPTEYNTAYFDTTNFVFNTNEKKDTEEEEDKNYLETLIVKKDTVDLSEDLDERINNTLFEIIPNNPHDKFRISACYLSYLGEVLDHRKYTTSAFLKLETKLLRFAEKTAAINLKDSVGRYFWAFPHTADMVAVTVKNGKVVPVKKANTKSQDEIESNYDLNEIKRIKTKYKLKDTIVVIPGEYDYTATLTKNKKLFGYGYDAYLFRIDVYHNNAPAETKYIRIYISYGC